MRQFFTLPRIAVFAFAMLMAASGTFAQAPNQAERQVKVKIIQATPGNTQVVDEVIPVEGNANVEEILRQYNVSTDFGDLQPGETLEITIRKKQKQNTVQDMVIELDPLMDMPAPPAPPRFPERIEEVKNKPMLGVYYTPVPDNVQDKFNLSSGQGCYISSVISGTGAETAGLKGGDILMSVDGEEIKQRGDLPRIIQAHKPGDVIKVAYAREGDLQFATVTLGEWKNRRANSYFNFNFDDNNVIKSENRRIIIKEKDGEVQRIDIRGGDSERAFLGVHGDMSSDENGAKLSKITDNSTASAMGLEAGDVITSANGESIANFKELGAVIRNLKPGDNLSLKFTRNGEEITSNGALKSKSDTPHAVSGKYEWKDNNGGHIIKHFQHSGVPHSKIVEETTIVLSMEEISGQEASSLQESTQGQFKAEGAHLNLENLSFYPNPSDGLFNLSFDLDQKAPVSIQVFDLNGVSVYKNDVNDFNGNFNDQIDIREKSKGVYFLQVTQGEKIFNKKIVVQ